MFLIRESSLFTLLLVNFRDFRCDTRSSAFSLALPNIFSAVSLTAAVNLSFSSRYLPCSIDGVSRFLLVDLFLMGYVEVLLVDLFFLMGYVENRLWWPVQSLNTGRKKKASS